jgi:hypothetical protein
MCLHLRSIHWSTMKAIVNRNITIYERDAPPKLMTQNKIARYLTKWSHLKYEELKSLQYAHILRRQIQLWLLIADCCTWSNNSYAIYQLRLRCQIFIHLPVFVQLLLGSWGTDELVQLKIDWASGALKLLLLTPNPNM